MKEEGCLVNDCLSKVIAKGFCNKHYLRLRKYGDASFTQHKINCSVIGCVNKHALNGYCVKHNKRIERHGDPLYISRNEPLFGSLEDRFNKSYIVDKETECWNWIKSLYHQGYGKIDFSKNGKRKSLRAHRLSYELFKGTIPKNLLICHSCDNPKCVNPEHLWLGTYKDNVEDMDNKGRRAKKYKWKIYGELHFAAKLKNYQVVEIREKLAKGYKGCDLAKEFGVCKQTISSIKNGKRWNNI